MQGSVICDVISETPRGYKLCYLLFLSVHTFLL